MQKRLLSRLGQKFEVILDFSFITKSLVTACISYLYVTADDMYLDNLKE